MKYIDLLKDYFRTQWKWIMVFILFAQIDLVLTQICVQNNFGSESNPFVFSQVMNSDIGFVAIRTLLILILILITAQSKSSFIRFWLLQSVTIGYTLVLLNNAFILIYSSLTNSTETPHEPLSYITHILIIVSIILIGFFILYLFRKYVLKWDISLKEVFK